MHSVYSTYCKYVRDARRLDQFSILLPKHMSKMRYCDTYAFWDAHKYSISFDLNVSATKADVC